MAFAALLADRAPIDYLEIRRTFQSVRAATAFVLAILAAVATYAVDGYLPFFMPVLLLLGADAAYRRTRGATPMPSLMVDATVVGLFVALRGSIPNLEIAAVAYLVAAAILLLTIKKALLLLVYVAGWAIASTLLSTLTDGVPIDGVGLVLQRVAMAVFIMAITAILLSAANSLRRMRDAHAEALETERRAVRLKDEFVSMVSHELRTPLTAISGFTDTLRAAWQDLRPEEVDEYIAIIRQETIHLGNLVEDILVIPRLEAGRLPIEMVDLDLRAETDAIVDAIFPPGSTRDAVVSIPIGVIVKADPIRLRQVLRNLLDNARKYGGDQILVEAEAIGDGYLIVVSDNGRGVMEEDRDRIFEHFEQVTKGDARIEQGVGLGLPIARNLTRAMGGDLWYEQRFPTGARFCFTLSPGGLGELETNVIQRPAGVQATPSVVGKPAGSSLR